MEKLAIIIPAFKINFFDQALRSIAQQTCKNFTVYIGNDASESNFEAVIEKYTPAIDIVYKRFDKNLGGKNLVQQWERCIDLIKDEEWIWLFSDDDLMEPNCVEKFYSALDTSPGFNIYHFDVLQVDALGKVTDKFFVFPDLMSSEEFIVTKLKRLKGFSTAVEYIFKKSHFLKEGRFTNFDLAWGSDDATWIKLARKNGIKAISDAKVCWRESSFNISPNNSNKELALRKVHSEIQFAKWVVEEFKTKSTQVDINHIKRLLELRLFNSIKYKVQFLSFATITKLLSNSQNSLRRHAFFLDKIAFLYMYKTYKHIKNRIIFPMR